MHSPRSSRSRAFCLLVLFVCCGMVCENNFALLIMNNPIYANLSGVNWHEWNEVLDLIQEMEAMARQAVPDFPEEQNLYWHVTAVGDYMVRLQVGCTASMGGEHSFPDFEVTLFCRDLEDGTTISLNGQKISHSKYKGLISAALAEVLRNSAIAV